MHEDIMVEDSAVEDSAVQTEPEAPAEDDGLLESLLVEEVSIDGMCGVY